MSEVGAREGRVKQSNEEEEGCLAHSFHITLMSVKLRQAVCQATDRDGGGVSSQGMSE